MYRNLCVILVLFAVLKSTFTVAEPVNVVQAINHCREAHNISDDFLRQLVLYNLPDELNDPNGQCFVACWLEQTRILKPDGSVDLTDLIDALPRDIRDADGVTEEFRKCADQPGEGCEKKYKIAVCIDRAEALIKSRKSGEMGKQSEAQ